MKARKQGTTYTITGTLKIESVVSGVKVTSVANLTGSTLTFWMRSKRTGITKLSGVPMTIVAPTLGTWSLSISATYFDTADSYEAEIHEIRGDGTDAKWPSDGYEPVEIQESIK